MEAFNNGNGVLLSPPHNNSGHHHQQQRAESTSNGGASAAASSGSGSAGITSGENNIQITQPISAPSSPLASPGAINTTSFCLPSSSSSSTAAAIGNSCGSGSYVCSAAAAANGFGSAAASNVNDTADPNWQATKATVLERNAAMFNNELMSDIKFVVGGDFGELCFVFHKGN